MNRKIFAVCVGFSVLFILGSILTVVYFSVDATLSLNGEEYLSCEVFSDYTEEGSLAKYLWFNLDEKVECVSDVDTSRLGEYSVKYTMNYHGKEYDAVRIVQVVDTTPPEIAIQGSDPVSVSSMDFYVEEGYTATDNYDGDITNRVRVERINDEDSGICKLVYTVHDFSGNLAKAERTVIVQDKTAPVLILNGSAEININTPNYKEPGYTAVDDLDGDISGRVTVDSNYESGVEGTFTFTYTVSDSAGNTSTAERTVNVKDTVAPVLSIHGDKTVYIGLNEGYTDSGAAADDAFDGDISANISVTGIPDTSATGTYEVRYYVEDSKGNSSSAVRKVIVFRRPVIIDVPYISQNGKYPNGCESVSAVMALQYAGIDISVDKFIDEYLNMDKRPTIGQTGPDIDVAYGGNPRSNDGWGCNSPVIVNAMNKFVDSGSYNISHAYGTSLDSLCKTYIDNGIPVIVWATVNMVDSSASKYYVNWTTEDGRVITYNKKLHCVLLVGYDDDKYYFNDPKSTGKGTSYIGYPRSQADTAYGIMNSQSIAVYRK